MENIKVIIEWVLIIIGVASSIAVTIKPIIKKLESKRANKIYSGLLVALEFADKIVETFGLNKVAEKQKESIKSEKEKQSNTQ